MLTAGLLFYKQFILSFPLWLFLRKLEQILKFQQFEGRGIVLGIMQVAFFLHPLISEKVVLLLLLSPHKCHLGSVYNFSFTEIFLSTFCRTSFSSVKKKNTKKKKKTWIWSIFRNEQGAVYLWEWANGRVEKMVMRLLFPLIDSFIR